MNAHKITVLIALVLILGGFCLPWIYFYGNISGLFALKMKLTEFLQPNRVRILDSIVLFGLIPIFSTIALLGTFAVPRYRILPLLYLLIVDSILIYALIMMLDFVSFRDICYGYYIMTVGIIFMNIIVIKEYVERKQTDAHIANLG